MLFIRENHADGPSMIMSPQGCLRVIMTVVRVTIDIKKKVSDLKLKFTSVGTKISCQGNLLEPTNDYK